MMFLDRRGMWGRCDGCRDRAGPGSIWFGVRGDAGRWWCACWRELSDSAGGVL